MSRWLKASSFSLSSPDGPTKRPGRLKLRQGSMVLLLVTASLLFYQNCSPNLVSSNIEPLSCDAVSDDCLQDQGELKILISSGPSLGVAIGDSSVLIGGSCSASDYVDSSIRWEIFLDEDSGPKFISGRSHAARCVGERFYVDVPLPCSGLATGSDCRGQGMRHILQVKIIGLQDNGEWFDPGASGAHGIYLVPAY